MKDFKEFKTEIGGKEVVVEIGKYAFQTNGHCIVRCGDTVVMCNTCMNKEPRPGQDFFPLSVDFEEKLYAVGKIPGGFKKREGRQVFPVIGQNCRPKHPIKLGICSTAIQWCSVGVHFFLIYTNFLFVHTLIKQAES